MLICVAPLDRSDIRTVRHRVGRLFVTDQQENNEENQRNEQLKDEYQLNEKQ